MFYEGHKQPSIINRPLSVAVHDTPAPAPGHTYVARGGEKTTVGGAPPTTARGPLWDGAFPSLFSVSPASEPCTGETALTTCVVKIVFHNVFVTCRWYRMTNNVYRTATKIKTRRLKPPGSLHTWAAVLARDANTFFYIPLLMTTFFYAQTGSSR